MNKIYTFLEWLGGYVDAPKLYGTYHISWIIGLIALCVIFAFITKKHNSNKFFKTTLLICWILLVSLEIIKEVAMGFSMADGKPHYEYLYVYFPYQLCSLPFYVLPFVIFLKEGKLKEYFVSATVSYILLGGVLLVLIPGAYKNILYINFHTMIHHSLQVFTSFVCILWYKKEMTFKKSFKCILPIVVTMSLAIIFNIGIYKITGKPLQLWNLHPYITMDMQILENIKNAIGYIPYVLLYFVVLSTLSIGVYMIPVLLNKKKQ